MEQLQTLTCNALHKLYSCILMQSYLAKKLSYNQKIRKRNFAHNTVNVVAISCAHSCYVGGDYLTSYLFIVIDNKKD